MRARGGTRSRRDLRSAGAFVEGRDQAPLRHGHQEVPVFGDLAVVRLVWTLTIEPKDGATIESIERGWIFSAKQADGSWKIIRYMAYERE